MSSEGRAASRVRAAYRRIRETDRPEVWITLRPEADAMADAERVDAAGDLPLAGKVVAVKDNIDVLGLPTTAGCPAFAYDPTATAPCVQRLIDAGAIVLGKTNLDQFATGLVGTRTPYGAVRNAWAPERIAGGSSSGSAVAVALGIADLGISTDTAGSGRVPAAFAGIVGFKPTFGLVSNEGVVPASRSFDCVGVFAATVAEAEEAMGVMARGTWPPDAPCAAPPMPVVAVPAIDALGELTPGWADFFAAAIARLAEAGATIVEIDVAPFLEGGRLLYGSAIVSERYAAVGAFVDEHPGDIDPNVRAIIGGARELTAAQFVRDVEQMQALRDAGLAALGDADALLLPTVPEHPTLRDVDDDPIGLNRRLGRFVSFANPFGFSAVSVPAAVVHGLPFGVTVYARGFADRVAADVARLVSGEAPATGALIGSGVPLMVVGAHLSGQPLNHQLTGGGARLVGPVQTAPRYRLYALATDPPKPGLLEVGVGGSSIEGEVWELPPASLASLLAGLPKPMTLGRVTLDDGTEVVGFSCQAAAVDGTEDITSFGGWRDYLASRNGALTAGSAR